MRGVGAGSLYPNVSVTNGGDANGLTVIPTEALDNSVVIVDGRQIAANPGTVLLDVSEQADIQLTDTPTDGDTTAATVNLWASNLSCLRARRFGWGATLLRSTAAAVITDLDQTE